MIVGVSLSLFVLAAPEDRDYVGAEAVEAAGPIEVVEVVEAPAKPAPREAPAKPVMPGAPSPGRAARTALERPPPGEPPRPKWWGSYPRPKLTGFGGPVLQLTGLTRSFAAMVGLAGGLTIRQRVSLGATALWLLNPVAAGRTEVGAEQRLNVNFGGLLLAVVVARTKRVDFTIEGIVGGGGACLQNPKTGSCYARTAMFVGQPGVGLHVRLAPVVRLALGLGYRLVAAKAWAGPSSLQLGAPVGNVMLEFGLF
ncbi:MAG: hypothetical protein IPO88_07525 [Nannocystis sp.]|uniref:hypothetical protein n=1 Tax=Nannocystis sp. TaxID=1962667 RepID=UPI0024226769|nr:hypothetical protein [Nannocystis sp.]MBK9753345.1 hypothetical protein [Nannocystis sp.]